MAGGAGDSQSNTVLRRPPDGAPAPALGPARDGGAASRPVAPRRASGDTRRQAIERFLRIALWAWPSFTVLDVFMATVTHPRAPLWLFLTYRLAGELFIALAYRCVRRPGVTEAAATAWYLSAYYFIGTLVALMALHLGGLLSTYQHGISIAMLVHLILIPLPFRRALLRSAPMFAAFPVVMGVAALVLPDVRAAWCDGASLAAFGSNYVFVAGVWIIGAAASHNVWAAREQVYRARRLGRYRLQAPIGRGGMGEVWLAWDDALRRNVALKILRPEGRFDEVSLERFEREAQAASRLRSPHCIQIFDFGASDDGIHFIAMEYLEGLDLQKVVARQGPLTAMHAVGLLLQACEAFQEAHTAGVVHRDVKPSNLFVTRVGDERAFVKVLDFGIARVLEVAPLTRTGSALGTPGYMAPEVWHGARADARQDVYGLGATLFFLLTGAPPGRNDDASTDECAPGVRPAPPPSRRAAHAVSPELDAVVVRCLALDPAQRYRDAGELREALVACYDPGGWTAEEARRFWDVAGANAAAGRDRRDRAEKATRSEDPLR